ncbi:MAG: GGDEF domain-containing protein [Gammaproteobacteria bacterium]
MHPTLPGLGRWALAGGFGVVALLFILSHGAAPWLPSLALAQAFIVAGLALCWDGFRRFSGRRPLSYRQWLVLAVVVLGWIAAAQVEQSLELRVLGNAILVAVLSALIARDLLTAPEPVPLAMRATGWAYAANTVFFLVRTRAADHSVGTAGPLNPDIAVTLGMVLMAAERLQADLDSQANRDPLTGALNRRAFSLIAEKETARARRYGQPLSVLIMDLDKFKQLNDRLGHDGGDALLCAFVDVTGKILRGEDVFCRFGGEEFVALLPDTSARQALVAAERLRAACAKESAISADLRNTEPFALTVSIGIGELAPDEDIESLIRRADAALYRAKGMGRNRCELADHAPQEANDTGELQSAARVES